MRCSSASAARSVACKAHGDAHAATDAQRGKTLLGIAFLHFVEQRYENARAGGADRMADRNRAAVDVDLRGVPTEVLVDGARLSREGFIGLDEVEVANAPACFLERRPGS